MYDYERRAASARTAAKDSRFPSNLQRDIERDYGRIKEIHYEDSRCEDGDGNLVSDPYFTVITHEARLTVILKRDFRHIKEVHRKDD